MKILITGGAGFIASQIAEAYLAAGHAVTIVDNLSTGRKVNIPREATFVEADIRDAAAMNKLFSSTSFDLMSHHAAQMDVRKSVADPVYDASVNVLGVLTLLQECVRTGVKHVVFASSGGAIYGEQDFFPADETHPTRPISPYGVAKLTTEQYLFYYYAVFGLNAVCLRYANIYGPRQNPEGEAGVVAIFANRMFAGQEPVINGEGKQTRDYVFVGDVVRANVAAVGKTGFHIYNVGTGRETDVNHLFRVIRDAVGSTCPEQHGEAKKGEQLRSVLSHERIKKELGWTPSVTLEEGLARTVDHFRNALKAGGPAR
ncbi:MAG: NAD-dependent epimerase/dehydratase family protein [Ignavibacteriae bacterium]|nr:NAD-dependent epimerase/dehydratase family protein [Ignavibacteriota bacterium]